MKLTQFAVLIYLVSTFHESLAQTNSAPKQSRREPEDTENSSQENRKKIKANLGGELFLGYGFVTGFQASPDLSLELWYDKAITATASRRPTGNFHKQIFELI